MQIYDALLSEKRILVVGHSNVTAGEVCEVTCAIVLMLGNVIPAAHLLYPHCHLSNLDFLNTPGFIAGVTNPMFKHRN